MFDRWYVITLVATIALASAPHRAAVAQDAAAEARVQDAQALIDRGDFRAALVTLLDAAQQAPESIDIRRLLATTALELGDAERAEKEIDRAMRLGLEPSAGWPILVQAVFRQGDMDRVIEKVVHMPVQTSVAVRGELLGMRGYAEAALGSRQRAQQTLDRALSLNPQSLQALLGKALLAGHGGKLDEARDWIEKAIATHTDSADARLLLGDLELAEGNYAAAAVAFRAAVDRRDSAYIGRARRGLALTQLGRFDEAAAELAALADAGWAAHPYTQYVRGRMYFAQQRYREAAEAFDASYADAPGFLANRLYLAAANILIGRPEQAREHAEFVATRSSWAVGPKRLRGSSVTVTRRRGIEADASQYPVVKEALTAALEDAPGDATILRLLASIALLQGIEAEAEARLATLRELEPSAQDVEELADAVEPAPTAQASTSEYQRDLISALGAVQQGGGDSARALTKAQDLATKYPDAAEPINLVAAVYLMMGQWDVARVELRKSLALDPDQPDVVLNLAKVEVEAGNLRDARALLLGLDWQQLGGQGALLLHDLQTRLGNRADGLALLQQVLDVYPEAADVRARLAKEAMRDGHLDRALELTETVDAAAMATVPELFELRGRAQLASGAVDEARETFEGWVRVRPDSRAAQFLLAEALARTGQTEAAHTAIDTAVELDPGYLPARISQIKSLVLRNRHADADKAISRLKVDFGETPETLGIEGWYALATGDHERARQNLTAALSQRTDSGMVQLLFRTLWLQEAYDEALRLLERYITDEPEDLPVLAQYADGLLARDRHADATAVFARILDSHPNHVPALNNLAWLNREGDPKKALEYARRAFELAPEDPYVLDTLGMLLIDRGELEEGLGMVQDAAKQRPGDPEFQLHLAQALAQNNRPSQARSVLTQLLEDNPDSAQATHAKALLTGLLSP